MSTMCPHVVSLLPIPFFQLTWYSLLELLFASPLVSASITHEYVILRLLLTIADNRNKQNPQRLGQSCVLPDPMRTVVASLPDGTHSLPSSVDSCTVDVILRPTSDWSSLNPPQAQLGWTGNPRNNHGAHRMASLSPHHLLLVPQRF